MTTSGGAQEDLDQHFGTSKMTSPVVNNLTASSSTSCSSNSSSTQLNSSTQCNAASNNNPNKSNPISGVVNSGTISSSVQPDATANGIPRKSAHRLVSNFFSNLFCCCFRSKTDNNGGKQRKQSKKLLNSCGGSGTGGNFGDNSHCYGDSFYSAAAGGHGSQRGQYFEGQGKFLLPPLSPCSPGNGNAAHHPPTLVIDLDETLVHSSFKPISNADFIVPVEIDGTIHQVYVLKRPFVDEFLQKMGQQYECVLFTASLAKYADPVADLLDKWGVFRSRLFRESCVFYRGNYVKDLGRLGRELSRVIIVDNSPASYIFHPDNAVPVASWFDDMSDTELRDLVPFFEKLSQVDNVYSVLRSGCGGQTNQNSFQANHMLQATNGANAVLNQQQQALQLLSMNASNSNNPISSVGNVMHQQQQPSMQHNDRRDVYTATSGGHRMPTTTSTAMSSSSSFNYPSQPHAIADALHHHQLQKNHHHPHRHNGLDKREANTAANSNDTFFSFAANYNYLPRNSISFESNK